jgi:hypothetical protein
VQRTVSPAFFGSSGGASCITALLRPSGASLTGDTLALILRGSHVKPDVATLARDPVERRSVNVVHPGRDAEMDDLGINPERFNLRHDAQMIID